MEDNETSFDLTPTSDGILVGLSGVDSFTSDQAALAFYVSLDQMCEFLDAIQICGGQRQMSFGDVTVVFDKSQGTLKMAVKWKAYEVTRIIPQNQVRVIAFAVTGWLNNLLIRDSLSLK